jgi:hypothetical protein
MTPKANGTLVGDAGVELNSTLSTDTSIDGTIVAALEEQHFGGRGRAAFLGSRKYSHARKKPFSTEPHPSST